MFTGLIEAVGILEEVEEIGDARRLRIGVGDKSFLSEAQIGESIAVSGVCLTATEYSRHNFSVSAVEETLRRTTLGRLKIGDFVNLERALKANARLGGHIVQGHVDGVGTIIGVREEGEGWWVSFEPPFDLMKHIVEKGSICIDGISLTVANVAYARFSVALIPHTRAVTTAGDWEIGKTVNLEADIIAKHVERLMVWNKTETQG
jgi:riboflavin synthase